MTKTTVMPEADQPPPKPFALFRLIRIAIAGVLMGTANLIPGVSGGTMVLAMGIYQEFIDSVADITALRFFPAADCVSRCARGLCLDSHRRIGQADPVFAVSLSHWHVCHVYRTNARRSANADTLTATRCKRVLSAPLSLDWH